jgi:acyl-CoA thioester hydrolase
MSALAPFDHRVRVLFGDTDAAGIVYHANYLRYLEAARGELLRARGLPYAEIERRGLRWPVVEARLRYLRPARFDDLLVVRLVLAELGGASVRFASEILRDGSGERLCSAELRLACTTHEGRVARIPDDVRKALLSGP